MRALALLGVFLFSFAFSGDIGEEEFRKDVEYVKKVEKRLDEIDREVMKGHTTRELLGELNSYGYPLYTLRDKYRGRDEEKFRKFYRRVDRAYEKMLYVKRGAFPKLLMEEMRELNLPVCKIEASGKLRKTLNISVKDLKDEKSLTRMMTDTQLGNVHFLGIENLNFKKCE
ncbi:hypothetical protein [Hydrogenivirga sp.]